MTVKTYIEVNLLVVGYHCWPEAPADVEFLKYTHRHTFYIKCVKEVERLDREIEIIKFKNDIMTWLYKWRPPYLDGLDFEDMSCEQIAHVLRMDFELTECRVLEDGESGAIVIKHS